MRNIGVHLHNDLVNLIFDRQIRYPESGQEGKEINCTERQDQGIIGQILYNIWQKSHHKTARS
jgi:hypothetical protein